METKNKKSIIEELKSELTDLEKQLEKTSDGMKENYKKRKKHIASLIKKYAREIEETGEEKIHELKESSDELLDLLEADYDLSYTDFENNSHKISKAIDKYELILKGKIKELSTETTQVKNRLEVEINKNLDKFRTELDIQKAHFKGTKERAVSEFEEWKENRLKDVDNLKKELDQKKQETEVKFEKFSEEITVSYDHLKKAFKKLW